MCAILKKLWKLTQKCHHINKDSSQPETLFQKLLQQSDTIQSLCTPTHIKPIFWCYHLLIVLDRQMWLKLHLSIYLSVCLSQFSTVKIKIIIMFLFTKEQAYLRWNMRKMWGKQYFWVEHFYCVISNQGVILSNWEVIYCFIFIRFGAFLRS